MNSWPENDEVAWMRVDHEMKLEGIDGGGRHYIEYEEMKVRLVLWDGREGVGKTPLLALKDAREKEIE